MNNRNLLTFLGSLCFSILLSSLSWSSESIEEETTYQIGLRGFEHYQEGEYSKAVPLLKQALDSEEFTFASIYADICLRNLDGGNHTKEEAAQWYIVAADAGDGDATSYLESLSLTLLEQGPPQTRISALTKIWSDRELVQGANTGFEFYISGDFTNAAKYLKKASLGYHPLAQQFYADICLRGLDDKPHALKEAAMWYLLSALGGDSQSYSYLVSIVPNIFAISNPNSQMEAIVRKWVYGQTVSRLNPVIPKDVNNFLVFKFGRKINKTTAQKLPYFFDKFVNALFCSTGAESQSVIGDEITPIFENTTLPQNMPVPQNPCALEFARNEGRHFITQNVNCYIYGPVYPTYFASLDSIKKDGHIPKPDKGPSLSVIYQYILGSLYEATKLMNAKQFTLLSHMEYPWLLAGVKYWKEKYPSKTLSIQDMGEAEIMESLSRMDKAIPEEALTELRIIVEDDCIWPNDKDHTISKEFSENVRRFFVSSLSRDCSLVKQMEYNFFESLKSHTVNCNDKQGLEILQTPLFMFHCENLILNNVVHTQACSKAISQGQRYFFHLLHLTISYDPTFKNTNKTGQKIVKIINKLQNRGFVINSKS